jgi:hypothetical protein
MLQGESMGHEAMQGSQGESADVQALQHQATQHQGGGAGRVGGQRGHAEAGRSVSSNTCKCRGHLARQVCQRLRGR